MTRHETASAPRGPVEVIGFLHHQREALNELEEELQEAHEILDRAEEAWVKHYDFVVGELEEEADTKRLPGEDARISIARRRGGWEAWIAYRRAKKDVERFDAKGGRIKTQISAAQTEANLMRVV